MRSAFIRELTRLAQKDSRIMLVVGDLGFSVVEPFAEEYPEQFLNAGVAEQNMTGMAAGLALATDRVVFTYSIGNFPTLRCLEQIRNDICYHEASVKVVSVGGGVAYGSQGFTHFAVEDLAIMRALPGMTVVAPADPVEAEIATRLAARTPGPWYLRLGKAGEPVLHMQAPALEIGQSIQLQDGDRGTVFATGSVTVEALAATRILAEKGEAWRCVSMPFIKPLDRVAVADATKCTKRVVTIEEHNPLGGLGSAVAEIMAEVGGSAQLTRFTLPEKIDRTGSQSFLRKQYGLNTDGIVRQLQSME